MKNALFFTCQKTSHCLSCQEEQRKVTSTSSKSSVREKSGQTNNLVYVNRFTIFLIYFFRLSSKKNSLAGQSEMSSDGSNSSRKENVPPELMICIDMNTGESFNYFDGYLFMNVSKSQLFLPIWTWMYVLDPRNLKE